jgi:hypothetical protein
MLVQYGRNVVAHLIAITTSSSAALPARSPMPLTVHSICRAPPAMPASEFATAMPRSLWQCTENTALSEFGTRSRTVRTAEIFLRHRVADGVGDIDGGGAGLDRGLDAAAEEIHLAAGAVLADHSTSSMWLRARVDVGDRPSRAPAPAHVAACISCAPARSRERCGCAGARAGFTASAQRSMSFGCGRDRPAITAFLERGRSR